MTRSRDLFERIRAGGYSEVEALVDTKVTEELFLDYKTIATVHPSRKLSDDDRNSYAKAISGFGNSDGGIIIWGVRCALDPTDGDVPDEIVDIPNPIWFKSLLDGSTSGISLPPHDSVENISVPGPVGNRGIVVTHIPLGQNGPYRAIGPRAKDYYLRAGSSFSSVPHGVLAGMFGRRPQPRITAMLIPLPIRDHRRLLLNVLVANEGPTLAYDLYTIVDGPLEPPLKISPSKFDPGQWYARLHSSRNRVSFVTRSDFPPLAPSDHISASSIQLNVTGLLEEDQTITCTTGASGSPSFITESRIGADRLSRIWTLITTMNSSNAADQLSEANMLWTGAG